MPVRLLLAGIGAVAAGNRIVVSRPSTAICRTLGSAPAACTKPTPLLATRQSLDRAQFGLVQQHLQALTHVMSLTRVFVPS
jgi:hypothetical protein